MARTALSPQLTLAGAAPSGTVMPGIVTYWNDKRGYGFIDVGQGRGNVFFHISAFAYRYRRPRKGEAVTCLLQAAASPSRPAAARVVRQGDEKALFRDHPNNLRQEKLFFFEGNLYVLFDILFFAVLTWLSAPIALAYAVISVLSVALYSYDKYAAIAGKQRVPEASFYLSSLLGGWPGALIARPFLRHKVSKNRFILFFWMTIVVNLFCLQLLIWYIYNGT